MAATKRSDEGSRIIPPLQGECRELQSSDPPLCACLQQRTLFRRKRKPHHLYKERSRLLWPEPEISGTQLQHIVMSAQLRKRKRRVFPCRKNKMHVGRKMMHKKGHGIMNGFVGNDVIIVQDENEIFPRRAALYQQVVDQQREH